MADQQEGQEPTPNEPQGQGNEPAPDYKALYEKALGESRKWESRAKSNKAASERLEKLGSLGIAPGELFSCRLPDIRHSRTVADSRRGTMAVACT